MSMALKHLDSMRRINVVRIVVRGTLSPLEGALLGLLHELPRSGYALRKLFATTPMGTFSDSPGSIYPALRRLARRKFIAGNIENARSLRPRQVFRLTPQGLEALRGWLLRPVVREELARNFGLILLRFVFMPPAVGVPATRKFLQQVERGLAAYVRDLRVFAKASASTMPVGGRLGVDAGVEICTAHLRWTRHARRTLARSGRGHSSRRS